MTRQEIIDEVKSLDYNEYLSFNQDKQHFIKFKSIETNDDNLSELIKFISQSKFSNDKIKSFIDNQFKRIDELRKNDKINTYTISLETLLDWQNELDIKLFPNDLTHQYSFETKMLSDKEYTHRELIHKLMMILPLSFKSYTKDTVINEDSLVNLLNEIYSTFMLSILDTELHNDKSPYVESLFGRILVNMISYLLLNKYVIMQDWIIPKIEEELRTENETIDEITEDTNL